MWKLCDSFMTGYVIRFLDRTYLLDSILNQCLADERFKSFEKYMNNSE